MSEGSWKSRGYGKGKIVRDEGTDRPYNFTYHGGGLEKSRKYKERYLPNYDSKTGTCKLDGTQTLSQTGKMESWNTFQKNTWYQDHMNHVTKEDCPPGLRAEFRQKGVVEKEVSLRETGVAVFDVYSQGQGYLGRTRNSSSAPDVFVDTYSEDRQNGDHDFDFTLDGSGSPFGAQTTGRPNSPSSGECQYLTGTYQDRRPQTAAPFTAGGQTRVQATRKPRPLSSEALASSQNRMRIKTAQDRAIEAAQRTSYHPPAQSTQSGGNKSGFPNPKTMFIPQNKPVFGPKRGDSLNCTRGTTVSSMGRHESRPTTAPVGGTVAPTTAAARSVRFSDTNEDDGRGYEAQAYCTTNTISGAAAATESRIHSAHSVGGGSGVLDTEGKQHDRSMSAMALTRRHMGVTMGNGESTSKGIPDARTQPASLTARLTSIAKDNGSVCVLSGNSLSGRPHLHPSSGYERGLRGTLYANFWRAEELMRADGKICFHPLSYDVLETLTYGPPDPANNILQNDVFPPMPPNRRKLIKNIFQSVSNRSTSGAASDRDVMRVGDLVNNYDAANHPAAVGKRATSEEILDGIVFDMLGEEMFATLQTYHNALDHEICYDNFEHHYAAVSAVTYCDVYFERLLFSTWRGLDDVWSGNDTIRRMIRTHELEVKSVPLASRMSTTGRTGTNYVSRLGNIPFNKVMTANVSKDYQKRALEANKAK